MAQLGKPTIGGQADPTYKYPRDVEIEPPIPGIPEGWKAVEQVMGPKAKNAGAVYLRYSSLDGRHKHLSSVKALIVKHCEDNGIPDPGPVIAEYQEILKQRKDKEKEETRMKQEAKAAEREDSIARFREKFGGLTGPTVSAFPGWTTTWDFLPNSGQVQTRYIDSEGGDWFILKDLEWALQKLIDKGEPGPGGVDIGEMIETGRKNVDETAFALGAATARESQGRYERTADGDGKHLTREESVAQREVRKLELVAKRAEELPEERRPKKVRKTCYDTVSPHPRGPVQEDWATLRGTEDLRVAFATFRKCLEARFFSEVVELVAVHGATPLYTHVQRHYACRIVGVYYQMDALVEGRCCYQKLLHAPERVPAVCCDSVYISWNPSASRWQIVTRPGANEMCLAYCEDSQEHLAKVKNAWYVQEGYNDFREDSGISISTPDARTIASVAE